MLPQMWPLVEMLRYSTFAPLGSARLVGASVFLECGRRTRTALNCCAFSAEIIVRLFGHSLSPGCGRRKRQLRFSQFHFISADIQKMMLENVKGISRPHTQERYWQELWIAPWGSGYAAAAGL
jgi:hypothetical protein